MAYHAHSIYDTDPHFSINPKTRTILDESGAKTVLIQGDHNSERCTFEIPRLVDGHDMSLCNVVRVHYNNVDAATKATNKGSYTVNDLQLSPGDDQVVICSWLISRNATKYVGALGFLLEFSCVVDGENEYSWHTAVYSGISVSTGIDNTEEIVTNYPDILEQWRKELFSYTDSELAKIQAEGKRWRDLIPEEYEALSARIDSKASAIVETEDSENRDFRIYAAKGSPLSVTVRGLTSQAGSGEASVDNVRAISGANGAFIATADPDDNTTMAGFWLKYGRDRVFYGDSSTGVYDEICNWAASGCDRRLSFDGSSDEDWVLEGPNDEFFYIFRLDLGLTDYDDGLTASNRWPCGVYPLLNTESFCLHNGALYIALVPGTIQTVSVAGLRTYLASKPLTVFYRSKVYDEGADLHVLKTTVRWGLIDSYAGEIIPGAYISSTGGLHTGSQVLYVLAEPEVYMDDPKRLSALGTLPECPYSNTLSMAVTYHHDLQHYIDSKLAALTGE